MSSRQIALPGFRVDKNNRVVRDPRRLNVSARLKARGKSKQRWSAASRDWQAPPPKPAVR